MTDESGLNLTFEESNANATSLLSALSTVAELKTHLTGLSRLMNSEVTAPNADNSINMQVESDGEGTTCVQSEDAAENLPPFSHCILTNLARSILDNSRSAVNLIQMHRRNLLEFVEFAVNESELVSQELIENERRIEPDENSSGERETPQISLLDQTEVFELLERHVKHSVAEVDKLKSDFDKDRDQLSLELKKYKEMHSALEQENEALKFRCAELEQELAKVKDEHAAENKEWSTSYSQAMAQTNQLQRELDELREQSEHECQTLRSKYAKLQAELQDIAKRHVPAQLFPWIDDVPRRIVHYLAKVESHCPWLAAVLTTFSDDTVLPDPEALIKEHRATRQQLTTERDEAREKLAQVMAELSALRLTNAEQLHRLQEMEKQSQTDKSNLEKLQKNVLSYQSYFRQLLTPETTKHFLSTVNRISRGANSATPVAGGEDDSSKCSERSVSVNNSTPQSELSTHRSQSSSSASKTDPIVTASPSVLSRVTAAVSAVATALLSPRRTEGITPRRPPVNLLMRESAGRNQQSPDFPAAAAASESHATSRSKISHVDNASWSTGGSSHVITTTTPCVPVSAPTYSVQDAQPFVMPALPAFGRVHPGVKRKPLSEIPVIVEETESTPASREINTPTGGTVRSTAAWKHTQPTTDANKGLELEGGAFLLEGPLAESTSGPFRAPALPSTAAVDQNAKRPRPEPLSTTSTPCATACAFTCSAPNAQPFAMPAPRAAAHHPGMKRKPLSEIPVVVQDTGSIPPSREIITSTGTVWSTTTTTVSTWKRSQTAVEEKKGLELEGGAFLLEGPLAESTSGPFRAPAFPAAPVLDQNAKRPRQESHAGAFLLEGPLAESTAGPFRAPTLPPPFSGHQIAKHPRSDPIPNPVVSSKFASAETTSATTTKATFKPSPEPVRVQNAHRLTAATTTTRSSAVAFADSPAKSSKGKVPPVHEECSTS